MRWPQTTHGFTDEFQISFDRGSHVAQPRIEP